MLGGKTWQQTWTGRTWMISTELGPSEPKWKPSALMPMTASHQLGRIRRPRASQLLQSRIPFSAPITDKCLMEVRVMSRAPTTLWFLGALLISTTLQRGHDLALPRAQSPDRPQPYLPVFFTDFASFCSSSSLLLPDRAVRWPACSSALVTCSAFASARAASASTSVWQGSIGAAGELPVDKQTAAGL